MINPVVSIIQDYFYLRQRIPIFIYVFYLHFKESDNPAIDGAIKTMVSLIGLGTAYTVTGLIFDVPFKEWVPLSGGYPGLITWGFFFLIYYWGTNKKMQNDLTSFTFATLATVGGGWLYEISFFHPLTMWMGYNAIFMINSQILCLILLAYELKKMRFKPNLIILGSFIIFTVFSISLFSSFDRLADMFKIAFNNSHLFSWFYRIPACVFLMSLLGGIKSKARARAVVQT